MLGPFATTSRLTPIHQVSCRHGTAVARRLHIDVHNDNADDDDNDNAWQRGPQTAMAPWNGPDYLFNFNLTK